jgi:hypothetical protein
LFSLTLAACADNSHQSSTVNHLQADTVSQINTTNRTATTLLSVLPNNDTLTVDQQAVVFIEPDSLQIEKRKIEVGEENFYAGADDYLFYMNNAHEFTDSLHLTAFNAKNKKFIKFIRSDKTQEIINLDKLPELWNIYFFDPLKTAKQVDMTIIDEEYKSYFK